MTFSKTLKHENNIYKYPLLLLSTVLMTRLDTVHDQVK